MTTVRLLFRAIAEALVCGSPIATPAGVWSAKSGKVLEVALTRGSAERVPLKSLVALVEYRVREQQPKCGARQQVEYFQCGQVNACLKWRDSRERPAKFMAGS